MTTIVTVFFHRGGAGGLSHAATITLDAPADELITVAQPLRTPISPRGEGDLRTQYEHAARAVRTGAPELFGCDATELWVDTLRFSSVPDLETYGIALACAVQGRALVLDTGVCRRRLRSNYGWRGRIASLLPQAPCTRKRWERAALDLVVIWTVLGERRRDLAELLADGALDPTEMRRQRALWERTLDPEGMMPDEDEAQCNDAPRRAVYSYLPWT